MRAIVSCLAGVVFLATAASAQTAIAVDHEGSDELGKQLAFAIRDKIRGSASFSEAFDWQDATVGISILSLDPDEYDQQAQTIYSYNLLLIAPPDQFDRYVTSFVGVCGRTRIESCAASVFRSAGAKVDELLGAANR